MKSLVKGVLLAASLLWMGCGGEMDAESPAEEPMQSQEQGVYACSDGDVTVYCNDRFNCCSRMPGQPYCSPAPCP